MTIDETLVERFLGFGGRQADEITRLKICEVSVRLEKSCHPRWTGTRLPLRFENGFPCIEDRLIESRGLARNLDGCEEVILFAATIGPECDRLIQRAEAVSMSDAAICQAAGAAMIECFADEVNEQLRKEAEDNGQSLRPRFSPGYGDLPLDLQKYFSLVLDMPKTIGVRLNDSLLMVPSKSITAFIGIAPRETEENREIKAGCALCEAKDTCTYRRETS